MSWKSNALIVITVAGLAIGGLSALEPRTQAEIEQDRQQDQLGQLSDAQEIENDRRRKAGEDLLDANELDKLIPGEHRPPEGDLPRFRIRP